MTMQPGDVLLGKYRVERVLGRGGMGFVVAARHMTLDELFAIKLMLPEALANGDAVERFVREAKAAARLKGEHVARVHDVGRTDDGAPFMVMEHLVGDDLGQLLDKRGVLPFHEAALYVFQACEAIAEAHGHGIVHRDLKPSNLFLTARANGTPCVKVLDFGISKQLNPTNQGAPSLTVTGAFMGSPAFMSPEQMMNGKMADTRTDIWALGVILFELTTGALPFNAELMTELVAKVLQEPAIPPSHLRPGIPSAFDAVVLKCLEKKPQHRFQTVQELMEALRPLMAAKEPARPSSVPLVPKVDNGPDSGIDAPTLLMRVKPNAQVPIKNGLPGAHDETVEMPSEPKNATSRPVVTQTNGDEARKRKSPLVMVVAGIALFAAIASIGLLMTGRDELTPTAEASNEAPTARVSVFPAKADPPAEVVPAAVTATATTSAMGMPPKAMDSTAPLQASTSTPQSAPTSKQPRKTVKPSLY